MTDQAATNPDDSSASQTTEPSSDAPVAPPKKQENLILNIALNVAIPSLLLMKGESWFGLNPALLLVVALSFPVAYGIYDFIVRKKYNFFSILGFVSVLITGAVGLYEFPKEWIAIKEAAVPTLFGIAVLVSLKTKFPLVRTFLYNPDIFDVPKIDKALDEKNNHEKFDKLMVHCTLYLAASFALSAVLNYGLAVYFVRSPSGTPEFNAEVGKMMAWSWPVIVVPSMIVTMLALLKLVKGIKLYTGYEFEDVMLAAQAAIAKEEAKKAAEKAAQAIDTATE